MSLDISKLLDHWPFHPERVTVRIVSGEDSREKLQLRIDLGLLQMELSGRPDGIEIDGHATWLDFHIAKARAHEEAHPDDAPYQLQTEDCAELMREGVQFYHRYVSLWSLKRYELCARDTEHCLKLFRYVRQHARFDRDRAQFDQWRPYVAMMHARAVATPMVDMRQYDAAIQAIDVGIRRIREFLADYGREEEEHQLSELGFLRRWRHEITVEAGDAEAAREALSDPLYELRERLARAIDEERYEEAASLRDELRRLEDPPPPTGGAR